MFMITQSLLDRFDEEKDRNEFWRALLPSMKKDFEGMQLPSSHENVENIGAKLHFIHGGDWHLPFNSRVTKMPHQKSKDIIKAFQQVSDVITGVGGTVNGIISSGDHVSADAIMKHLRGTENTEQRRVKLWKEQLRYASKMLKSAGKSNLGAKEYRRGMLVIPGNHDVILSEEDWANDRPFREVFSYLVERHNRREHFVENDYVSPEIPACMMRYTSSGIVAFIGFTCTAMDSPQKRGCGFIGTNQTRRACDFIDMLRKTPAFSDKPIVVIGVLHHHLANIVGDRKNDAEYHNRKDEVHGASDNTIFDTRDFLETMSRHGMRFFIHGHQHTQLSYDLSYIPLADKSHAPNGQDGSLATISCCALPSTTKDKGKDNGIYHLAILTVDFELGKIYYKPIEYNHNRKTNKPPEDPGRSFPIHSVSNVPCDERRLYRNACKWLSLSKASTQGNKEDGNASGQKGREDSEEFSLLLNYAAVAPDDEHPFATQFNRTWEEKHVVDVCIAHSTKDKELKDVEFFRNTGGSWGNATSFYDLYAVLRPGPKGKDKHDLLMNYHVSIETPAMARWRSFLLPATKVASVADFVQVLRWNILRLLHAEDKIKERNSLEPLVEKLRGAERNCRMNSAIVPHTLATRKFYKISPTAGHPEILYYNLVQLSRFDPKDKAAQAVQEAISEALEEIPSLGEFAQFWKRQGDEPRGLAWIPLETALSGEQAGGHDDLLALLSKRNRDVLGFLQETIRTDSGTIKDNISIIGVSRKSDESRAIQRTFAKQSRKELFRRIHDVRLRGNDWTEKERRLYSEDRANVALVSFTVKDLTEMLSTAKPRLVDDKPSPLPDDVAGLYPAQNYVSEFGLDRIKKLEKDAKKKKIDIFTLKEYYNVKEDGNHKFDILPPVIEYSEENTLGKVWLICDGMHRIYSAIKKAKKDALNPENAGKIALTAIAVWPKKEGSWQHAPYYAFPTTWESVRETPNKPPAMYTKLHRVEKKEFRDAMEHVKPELLRDAKNFYREFERKDSPGWPFRIGTQGGE